jgi:hypothetical protein
MASLGSTSNPYFAPPVTIKTVSEFRRIRSGDSVEPENVKPAPESPESIDGLPPDEQVPVDCCSKTEALHYFDSECSAPIPTAFAADKAVDGCHASALGQFMNKAVDLKSAFQYAENVVDTGAEPSVAEGANAQATALPEAQAVSPVLSSPQASRQSLEQASVLKDPLEISGTNLTVEKDENGRVIKSLFCAGECICFNYDDAGELVEFNFANMDWTRTESGWAARDRQTDYTIEGRISVLESGSIRIEREDVVRTLKMSGTRIDEHKSGSRTESRKLKNKPSPYDLLARAKAVNSIWLSSHPNLKSTSGRSFPVSLKLDLVNESSVDQTESKSMIPELARIQLPDSVNDSSAQASSETADSRSQEISGRLRNLEFRLEQQRQNVARTNAKQHLQECFLKSSLWLTDRVAGQSSPKHLSQLDRLAQIYFERQRNDLAELTHMRALHIREEFYGKGQPELACSLQGLATIAEVRGNYSRAEELYKEAIELQANGLRKILFLFSEKVTDAARLSCQLDQLFACVRSLSNLYALQGRQRLCVVVYEKAQSLAAEIIEREPSAEPVLNETIARHMEAMKELA